MKAISLFKLLTLVSFLIVGLSVHAAETITCVNPLNVTRTTNCDTKYRGDNDKTTQCAEIVECLISKKDQEDRDRADRKDVENECKSLLSKYDEAASKVTEECQRVSEESYAKCLSKAKSCSRGLNVFAESEDGGEDSTASALVNLIGVYGQMQGANSGANGQSVAGCVISNNDSEADKEERIDDKITRLREEITKLRNEDVAEEDQKLNEKRQDVEADMLEARAEQEKAQTEAKTKNEKDAARLAERIVKVNAQKRQDLDNISVLNEEVNEAQVQIQKVVLTMPDKLVKAQCRGAAEKYTKEKLAGKKRFASKGEEAAFRDEVKAVEDTCLQAQAADKQEKINQINKAKKANQRRIANLKSKIADDAVTVQNSTKEIENLKNIATEQEKKNLENLTTKLNNLNKSVTDMEIAVERKKKGFEEKAKAKEDQINKILMDRQNVKSKFDKVYSTASTGEVAAKKFVNQCCESDIAALNSGDNSRSTVRGLQGDCARLRSDYEIKDVRPRSTRPRGTR